MNIPKFSADQLDSIVQPTPAQYADARRLVLRESPDLYAMVFGSAA